MVGGCLLVLLPTPGWRQREHATEYRAASGHCIGEVAPTVICVPGVMMGTPRCPVQVEAKEGVRGARQKRGE